MSRLADLWAGRLPLAEAFWSWAAVVGIAVNAAATAGTFAVIAADLPAWLALVVHLVPLPYNAAIAVGVWRSAAHYQGPRHWADAARAVVLVWAALLTLL